MDMRGNLFEKGFPSPFPKSFIHIINKVLCDIYLKIAQHFICIFH